MKSIGNKISPDNGHFNREMLIFAAFFAAVVVLFFCRELLSGVNLFEHIVNDAGFYFAWYPGGVETERIFRAGHFPLTSPDLGLTVPANGIWAQAVYYPLWLLTLPFGFLESANVYLLAHIWLMGVSAYLFARLALKMTPTGAAMAAVTFSFTGWALEKLAMGEMNVPWLMPLFAYAIGEQVPRPKWGLLLVAGLAGGTAILTGHPPQAFYLFFFGGAWWLYRWIDRGPEPGGLIGCLAAFTLPLLLTVIQLAPAIETMQSFWNHHPVDPLSGGYSVRGMYSLALPWLTGINKSGPIVVFLMPYMGLIPMALVLFGLLRLRNLGRDGAFFALVGLLFLGVAYLLPLFKLWNFLPGFNRLVNRISAAPVIALSVAMLSGLVLDYIIRDKSALRSWARFSRWMVPGLLIVAGYTWLVTGYMGGHPVLKDFIGPIELVREQWFYQVTAGLALLLVVASIAAAAYKDRLGVAVLGWIMVVTASAGLWLDHFGWNPKDPGVYKRLEQSEAIAALKEHVRSSPERPYGRVASDWIPPNLFWLHRLPDIRISAVFQPARYMTMMQAFNDLDLDKPGDLEKFTLLMAQGFHLPFPLEKINTPAGNLLGVRYAIVEPGSEPLDLPILYSGDGVIYENPSASPRAFIASGYEVFDSPSDVLDHMMNAPAGWEQKALFAREDFQSSEPWTMLPERAGLDKTASVEVKGYLFETADFEVTVSRPSLMILADLYMPGWKVEVNGVPARILQVDYLLRGVMVPPGKNGLRMWYEPASFKIGLWATVTTLIFFALSGVLIYALKRKVRGLSHKVLSPLKL